MRASLERNMPTLKPSRRMLQRTRKSLPLPKWSDWHFILLTVLTVSESSVVVATQIYSIESNTSLHTSANAAVAPHTAALAAPVAATSILEQFSPNCSVVAHVFVSNGIDATEIPQKPNNDMVLRYCESPSVGTCCTYSMETKMAQQSRLQLEKQSKEQIFKLSTMLFTKGHKFNDVFQALLLESKKEFHNMFTRTYGVIYQQNSYVFSDLFNELENYYARGRVDLTEVMDKFFNTLYQKMFQVLNAQYSFDEKYLLCVSEHMKELKPFGDVPDKLSVQLKRSFVATRTYGHALIIAAEVTKKLVNIRLNADCTTALTKMHHCGACKGYAEKPCTNYCINVMKGCLQYFSELETEWDNYVQYMDKVAERLLGSFNIVMVVEPINIKISEAIMNFQDSGRDITNRVFQGCGRPTLGRQTREIHPRWKSVDSHVVRKRFTQQGHFDQADKDIVDIDAYLDEAIVLRDRRAADPGVRDGGNTSEEQVSNTRGGGSGNRRNKKKQQNRKNDDGDYSGRDPILDKLIRDIRQRVKETKKFWSTLPHQLCNDGETPSLPEADNMCWNGHTIDRYMHSVTTEHGRNPEFPGNPATTRQTAMVTAQLYYLKNVINHLRNAYNGQDVDWSDQDDPYAGSGSGSGGGVDDEDDDEEGSGDDANAFTPNQKPGLQEVDHPSVRIDDEDDEDRSNILTQTSRPIYTGGGATHHDQDTNELEENSVDHADKETGSSGKSKNSPMSLRRALMLYLLPLYMAWFGGISGDLL